MQKRLISHLIFINMSFQGKSSDDTHEKL